MKQIRHVGELMTVHYNSKHFISYNKNGVLYDNRKLMIWTEILTLYINNNNNNNNKFFFIKNNNK